MKLYQITLTASKTFYVEAESESAALEHECVNDSFYYDQVDYEHDETRVQELTAQDAEQTKARYPGLILNVEQQQQQEQE